MNQAGHRLLFGDKKDSHVNPLLKIIVFKDLKFLQIPFFVLSHPSFQNPPPDPCQRTALEPQTFGGW